MTIRRAGACAAMQRRRTGRRGRPMRAPPSAGSDRRIAVMREALYSPGWRDPPSLPSPTRGGRRTPPASRANRKRRGRAARRFHKTTLRESEGDARYAAASKEPFFGLLRRYAAKPTPAKPSSIIAQVEGSGIAEGLAAIAMPSGKFNPEISAAFTVAPAVVYSPIVPALPFATNRSEPSTAILQGSSKPEISAAFTVVPAV